MDLGSGIYKLLTNGANVRFRKISNKSINSEILDLKVKFHKKYIDICSYKNI